MRARDDCTMGEPGLGLGNRTATSGTTSADSGEAVVDCSPGIVDTCFSGYDATYDIFIDPTYAPTNRNSQFEIMIWAGHRSPNEPLADKYTSSGPVPYATNVSLGGRTFTVYLYHWSGGGLTMSYVDNANPGWFSGSLTPFFNYGVSHGWYSNNDYLTSVMAGWEFGHGSYSSSSWGVAGL